MNRVCASAAIAAAAAIAALVGLAGVAFGDAPALDAQGRAMLDSLREEALRPAALIARLALAPDDVIADVGAGPGFLTLPLARAVPRGRVIATDVRADYLAVAAERAARAGLENVRTRVVPADRPGLDPRSINLAILCQLDHYLKDRAAYFAALVPALRRDGRIALINYARYREADLAAARAAGLRVVDEWAPSPPFFLLVLAPAAAAH
jgi:ubiquinone/menaquinone biosynthesis C-methylase UbiE